jgi:DNA topoisomerase-6 subunit B
MGEAAGRSMNRADSNLATEVFEEISPADFFYRNRDIAGFTNPSRAIYSTVRELLENSLDASELYRIPPDIYIRISHESGPTEGPGVYKVRVEDNGCGIPPDVIPSAFGQILFGSKYKLRQLRGTFGLGGKMAILYGQITTHSKVCVISSVGTRRIYEYHLMMDIQHNKPIVLKRKVHPNKSRWHGTIVEFSTEADYTRAMAKILDYLKQTAIVAPYANLTFVDPRGRLYKFIRATTVMPKPPAETIPHPHGVDVETIKRLIQISKTRTMLDFMKTHFQRVGETIARRFLDFAGIHSKKNPKRLNAEEIVKLVNAMKNFNGFLPPDAAYLSPLGEELLRTGIKKELNPEFIAVHQRKPAAYSGFPFIVEAGIAYGGGIPNTGGILLYRFANRIPLLFDEASDVSWKVVNNLINWRHYKVLPDTPIAVFVHLCSTKIPYKTVGKEFIADRPEVEHEILNAIREVARQLSIYLSRKEYMEREMKRLDVFSKYLPKIASFSTKLSRKGEEPDVKPLLRSVRKYETE